MVNRSGVGISRRESCYKCGHSVFLAERLHVGNHLYHRTCFRCARCTHPLSLANYYETEDGQFCCEICPDEVATKESKTNIDTVDYLDPKRVLTHSLSDEEKEKGLKQLDDEYSASFEEALEQSNISSSTLSRARDNFMSSQLDLNESESGSDSDEAAPPDLPATEPPDIDQNRTNLTDEQPVTFQSEEEEAPAEEPSVENLDDNDVISVTNKNSDSVDHDLPVYKPSSVKLSDSFDQPLNANAEPLTSTNDFDYTDFVTKEEANVTTEQNSNSQSPRVSLISLRKQLFEPESPIDPEPKTLPTTDQPEILAEELETPASHDSLDLEPSPNVNVDCDDNVTVRSHEDSTKLDVSIEINVQELVNVKPETAETPLPITEDISLETSRRSSKEYPCDLNPFGDDEEDEDKSNISEYVTAESKTKNSTNPFGSDDEDNSNFQTPNQRDTSKSYDRSLNPFGSDDESDDDVNIRSFKQPIPKPRTKLSHTPEPSPKPRKLEVNRHNIQYGSTASLSSINSSKTSTPGSTTRKKKPAPPPPRASEIFTSTSPNPKIPSPRPAPKIRKNRPAPAPPTSTPISTSSLSPVSNKSLSLSQSCSIVESNAETTEWEQEKINKDQQNRNRQSMTASSINTTSPTSDSDISLNLAAPNKSTYGKWKRKKGPAPPRPVPQRRQITQSLTPGELRRQLDEIEVQQQGLEKQGVKLEQLIREKCEFPGSEEDAPITIEVEDLVLELFELVNEKNELFRKQAELMYIRRQQRLEEEHADLEYQIRCLMSQPECNKTDTDKAREEELINRLVEVVERRNEIVECLEMDRLREAEEDLSINIHLNKFTAKRDEVATLPLTPTKLSKKEKKKIKREKKIKGNTPTDADKDIDESEMSTKANKKKKWFLRI